MSALDFFSPDASDADVVLVSPLARIDGGGTVTDVSSLGKLEVRGDIDALETVSGEHVVPLGPGRALARRPRLARRRPASGSAPPATASTT